MTQEVSFELAKLLNSKGLPGLKSFYGNKKQYALNPKKYTIGDVVMWLYKNHGIWIKVECPENSVNNDWVSYINKVGKFECLYASHVVNSPTEAYEAAIEYCLNELI